MFGKLALFNPLWELLHTYQTASSMHVCLMQSFTLLHTTCRNSSHTPVAFALANTTSATHSLIGWSLGRPRDLEGWHASHFVVKFRLGLWTKKNNEWESEAKISTQHYGLPHPRNEQSMEQVLTRRCDSVEDPVHIELNWSCWLQYKIVLLLTSFTTGKIMIDLYCLEGLPTSLLALFSQQLKSVLCLGYRMPLFISQMAGWKVPIYQSAGTLNRVYKYCPHSATCQYHQPNTQYPPGSIISGV